MSNITYKSIEYGLTYIKNIHKIIKKVAVIQLVLYSSLLTADYGETDVINIDEKIPKGWVAVDKLESTKLTVRDINNARFNDKWDILKASPIPYNWVIVNYSIAPISKEDGYTILYVGGAPIGCKVHCINISTIPQGWELYATHFKYSTSIEIIKKR